MQGSEVNGKINSIYDIVTDELYNKVKQENKDLLDEFIEYLQYSKSELTIIGYTSDINLLHMELQTIKTEFTDITKRDVMRYQTG